MQPNLAWAAGQVGDLRDGDVAGQVANLQGDGGRGFAKSGVEIARRGEGLAGAEQWASRLLPHDRSGMPSAKPFAVWVLCDKPAVYFAGR